MASFFRSAFDNIVHNINTIFNKTSTRQQSRTPNSHNPDRYHTTARQHVSHSNTNNPTTRQANTTTHRNNNMSFNESSQASNVANPTIVTVDEKIDIGDVHDPSDVNSLSAKQLKIILTRNCVDYKGVFEKEVLREKVMQLWIDHNEEMERRKAVNMQSKGSQNDDFDDIDDAQACKICMECPINCVLLECGHMLSCVTCGRKLAECPICRQNVIRCVRTFRG